MVLAALVWGLGRWANKLGTDGAPGSCDLTATLRWAVHDSNNDEGVVDEAPAPPATTPSPLPDDSVDSGDG
jgi:hypothetical protein